MSWYNIPASMPMIRRFRDVDEEISSRGDDIIKVSSTDTSAPGEPSNFSRLSRTAAHLIPWGSHSSFRRDNHYYAQSYYFLSQIQAEFQFEHDNEYSRHFLNGWKNDNYDKKYQFDESEKSKVRRATQVNWFHIAL